MVLGSTHSLIQMSTRGTFLGSGRGREGSSGKCVGLANRLHVPIVCKFCEPETTADLRVCPGL